MLRNWLKVALANYKKNWVSTLINILGLTVGLTGLILMVLYWNYESSFEQWNPNKKDVYVIENKVDGLGEMIMSNYPQAKYSTERFDEIEEFTLATYWGNFANKAMLKSGDRSTYSTSATCTENFFDFFPFERVAGNLKDAILDEKSMALSENAAKELFGDDYLESIGKVVKNDEDGNDYIVKGIYKLPSANTVMRPDFLVRVQGLEEDYNKNWTNFGQISFLKLREGTDVAALEEKLTLQQQEESRKNSEKWKQEFTDEQRDGIHVYLTRLDKMKMQAVSGGIDKADMQTMKILLGLSILILLLSAINFINLKTAQASQRAKEVGVRKTLGGGKASLVRQFLFETFLICLAASLLSIVLSELLIPAFNKFYNLNVALTGGKIYLYLVIGLLAIVLLAGIIPALYLANFKPIETLKGNFSRSNHGNWLRNGILTFQIVISSFFIIGSLIINQQVQHMLQKDLGFKADQMIHIPFHKRGATNQQRYERLQAEWPKNSGVESVTYGAQRIGKWISQATSLTKEDGQSLSMVAMGAIDLDYFDNYNIKMIAGRNFDPKLASDTINNTIINAALAAKMGWTPEEAVGKKIDSDNFDEEQDGYNVIGVVNDFHINGVSSPIAPTFYFNYDRMWTRFNMMGVDVKLKAGNIENTLAQLQEQWESEIEPGYPFEYYFVDKEFAKTFDKYKKQRTLFTILNTIALLVALLGLFALSMLMIEQKLKTVAIKKTLGANNKELVFGLSKQFLIITAIAVLISIPISYYFLNEWLKEFAYRIEMPWWPYIASLLALLILTFLVVSFKAYRATQISLSQYLKYE